MNTIAYPQPDRVISISNRFRADRDQYIEAHSGSSDARFLAKAYEHFLGRGIDEVGYNDKLRFLHGGLGRQALLEQIIKSEEFERRSSAPGFMLSTIVGGRSKWVAPSRSGLEQYQDIWVRGRAVQRGIRECAERFGLVADFCRKFARPFTVFDVGANLGYFSIRLAEEFDCTVVAAEGVYGDWVEEVLRENGNPRVILLKQRFALADLRELAEVEHFDVVLAMSVIHHLDGSFDESLEVLRSMGDHVILELPFESDACGQEIVREAVDAELPPETEVLGHGRSHLAEGERPILLISRPKRRLEKSYLGTPRQGLELEILSSFSSKEACFHNKAERRAWVRGINLQSYLWFHGSYPGRGEIARLVQGLKLDESPHRDIQPWNVVLQGDEVTLIDADDPGHAFAYDDRKYRARLVALLEAGSGPARNRVAAMGTRSELSLPVRWRAPLYNPSGYASEALQFILPLAERVQLGVMHDNNLRSELFVSGLPADQRDRLRQLEERYASASGGITIWHNPANGFGFDPDAAWNIGRTMFETDRVPELWTEICNRMDEVWVPSRFNVETFAASGVCRDKLRVMPGAVDDQLFDPGRHEPMALAGRASCNFLAMFEWSARKGWDVMLSAYLREFSAEDNVCLHLRTYLFSRPDEGGEETLWRRIREFGGSLGLGDKPWPRIELITQQIGLESLPGLYRAMDCMVAPSRGEGWGRPQHEAMLMELPVIGTNWSGNTEFMNERNSYLLEYGLETIGAVEPELWHYRGHRWANPSEGHLRQLMRHVEQHRDEARDVGRRARVEMREAYSPERVAERVLERLREIDRGLSTPACPAALARKLMVAVESPEHQPAKVEAVWEGSYLDHGSLSLVNRELTRRLDGREGLRLARVSSAAASDGFRNDPAYQSVARRLVREAPAQSRVTIRHGWPPDWRRPASGAWVLMQPWEFGAIPADWLRRLDAVDEIWVYSRHVWQTYVDSGVDPRKVRLLPLGVSADRFRPGVKQMGLATRKKFKFLYVGGSIRRKGVDQLLAGYLRAFTAKDDVCLVIKEFGADGVYAGKTAEGPVQAAQEQTGAPEILRITAPIPTDAMAGLYAACDCLVHPYRGEGFGLTVLEAMACGLPVIVTAGGATDDFATDEFAYRVPSRRVSIGGTVDGLALARNGWLLEPDLEALTSRLRDVFEHQSASRAMGMAASRYVREQWSWERSAAVARQRIRNLVARQDACESARATERERRIRGRVIPAVARLGALDEARRFQAAACWTKAWESATAAVRVRPFHPEGYLLLGEIAAASGDGITARECGEAARGLAAGWDRCEKFLKGLPAASEGPVSDWPGKAELSRSAPRLSVCLIVRNEERHLARCLASVKPVAWQVIVVDTGSSDRTVDIAREFGAEVHQHAWCDDFSAARNEALARARGDWVLSLDADEELSAESLAELERHMRTAEAMAFRLPLVESGKEEEGCHYVPRLFRNAPGVCFYGRIHEHPFGAIELLCATWSLENRLGKARILHHGYSERSVCQKDKAARNLRLLQLAIMEAPEDINLQMNIGLELARAGRLPDALPYYRAAFVGLGALPPERVAPELRETLLTQYVTHLLAAGSPAEAVQVLQSPLGRQGLSASQQFALGFSLLGLKRFEEAIVALRACLDRSSVAALGPANPEIHRGAPEHCMAICLWKLGRMDEARRTFEEAAGAHVEARALRMDWARFLTATGDFIRALGLAHELVKRDASDVEAWRLGGEIALSTTEAFDFAADWTGEAIKLHPGDPELCWQRAEAQLLTGDAAGAAVTLGALADPGARVRGVRTLCECLQGARPGVEPSLEPELSGALLEWYRTLVDRGASGLVNRINESMALWGVALPTAARILGQAIEEAATE